jgi:hydrogenase maturation protein HypF
MVEKLALQVGGEKTPLRRAALSGGVFQNRTLFERVLTGLEEKGFTVYTHSRVPCNDGGLALGQAAIAAARLLRELS